MNITEKIVQLKLNIQQHQAQIKILYGKIKKLEKYNVNSNDNIPNDNVPNDNSNDTVNSNVNVFCFDKVIKPSKKNENLKEFI